MIQTLAEKSTRWIGSIHSLIYHTIIFVIFGIACFVFNTTIVLLVLTTVVSLEAIYLAIFIQLSINKHDEQLKAIHHHIKHAKQNRPTRNRGR